MQKHMYMCSCVYVCMYAHVSYMYVCTYMDKCMTVRAVLNVQSHACLFVRYGLSGNSS